MNIVNEIMATKDNKKIFRMEGPFKDKVLELNSSVWYYSLTTLDPVSFLMKENPVRVHKKSIEEAIEKGFIFKYEGN